MGKNRRWLRPLTPAAILLLLLAFALLPSNGFCSADDGAKDAASYVTGDLDFDGVPSSIADFAIFNSYFAFGLGAFLPWPPEAVIPQTDVNCDSLTLTLSDLTRMGQILLGQAGPCTVDGGIGTGRAGRAKSVSSESDFQVDLVPVFPALSGDLRVLVQLHGQPLPAA